MRTLAATVSTKEEAEHISGRLRALGIASEHIAVRDVGQSDAAEDGAENILITVKVTPEQVSAATDILKGARSQGGAASSASHDLPVEAPPVERRQQAQVQPEETAPPPRPASVRPVGTRPAISRSNEHVVERSGQVQDSARVQAPAARGANSKGLVRIAFIAILLAALGLAIGALLGTLF